MRASFTRVRTGPGQTQLTVIPSAACSSASTRISPITPCLLATYAPEKGDGTRPLIDATVMIRPQRCARMCGSAAFDNRYGAVRLSSSVSSQKASLNSASGRGSALLPMPALLTRTSIGPNTDAARSRSVVESARSVRSQASAADSPPAAAISETTASSSSVERATTTTGEPLAAIAIALARPIPRPAPVTRATRRVGAGHGCVGAYRASGRRTTVVE